MHTKCLIKMIFHLLGKLIQVGDLRFFPLQTVDPSVHSPWEDTHQRGGRPSQGHTEGYWDPKPLGGHPGGEKKVLGGFMVTLSELLLRWLFHIFTWNLKVSVHGEIQAC